jgi:hypothetical protein
MSDAEPIMAARKLGATIERDRHGSYSWLWGRRSSVDQYCIQFETPSLAATHFLQSREADLARARKS